MLGYACTVWYPYAQTLIYKLEHIKKHAVCFVSCNYNIDSSITNIKSELGWEALQQGRKLLWLKFYFYILNDETDVNKGFYITSPYYTISHRYVHAKKVREIKCHTNVFAHSFFSFLRFANGISAMQVL